MSPLVSPQGRRGHTERQNDHEQAGVTWSRGQAATAELAEALCAQQDSRVVAVVAAAKTQRVFESSRCR